MSIDTVRCLGCGATLHLADDDAIVETTRQFIESHSMCAPTDGLFGDGA